MDNQLKAQLEELQLIQCSLLRGERLSFLDDPESWEAALEKYSDDPFASLPSLEGSTSFSIRVDGAKVWFEITFCRMVRPGGPEDSTKPLISVKGNDISRGEQEKWQVLVEEKMQEISDSEFPIYQLVSLHLLPLLHESLLKSHSEQLEASQASQPANCEIFHVLFTSHHLISPNKRRSLQQWSSSLFLTGFAKVGYPGVIYAQGEQSNIEEFVSNVKAIQWLALKVRFVEPLESDAAENRMHREDRSWKEFQKVGEVVEEMRRIGREDYVVEMGIGSAGVSST